eukprot:Amastigsp_a512368_17.p3 type:complete len:115 gc:universal Amastigsp_a512368_17:840-496(-)
MVLGAHSRSVAGSGRNSRAVWSYDAVAKSSPCGAHATRVIAFVCRENFCTTVGDSAAKSISAALASMAPQRTSPGVTGDGARHETAESKMPLASPRVLAVPMSTARTVRSAHAV